MPRNTFTEGRLESFERMMRSVPGRMKKYDPPIPKSRKERYKQRKYAKKK